MAPRAGLVVTEGSRPSGAGIVIPVDGPAGSGKSTMARMLADRLGWDYLESGALYRAVGLCVLEAGGDPEDAAGAGQIQVAVGIEVPDGRGAQKGLQLARHQNPAEAVGEQDPRGTELRAEDADDEIVGPVVIEVPHGH